MFDCAAGISCARYEISGSLRLTSLSSNSPEQELSYHAGTTRLRLTIDQPGVVDVESHTLEKTIVQLEVR